MNRFPLIVLLTDFGTLDPYVAILKGVISQIAPGVQIIDLSNEIPPGDIQRAAITLWQSYAYLPPDSVIVCVIDPGVGTSRRGVIVQSGSHTYIGPDNGIFTHVARKGYKAWELSNPKYMLSIPGKTFHGRDIFAPAAGYVTRGVAGAEFGQAINDLHWLPQPLFEWKDQDKLRGEILYSDRFGNLITSLGCFVQSSDGLIELNPWLPGVPEVQFSSIDVRLELPNGSLLSWKETFAEVPADQCGVIIGSSGLLEIVANCQSAERLLGVCRGAPVTLIVNKRS